MSLGCSAAFLGRKLKTAANMSPEKDWWQGRRRQPGLVVITMPEPRAPDDLEAMNDPEAVGCLKTAANLEALGMKAKHKFCGCKEPKQDQVGLGAKRSNTSTIRATILHEVMDAEPESSALDLLKASSSELGLGPPQGTKFGAQPWTSPRRRARSLALDLLKVSMILVISSRMVSFKLGWVSDDDVYKLRNPRWTMGSQFLGAMSSGKHVKVARKFSSHSGGVAVPREVEVLYQSFRDYIVAAAIVNNEFAYFAKYVTFQTNYSEHPICKTPQYNHSRYESPESTFDTFGIVVAGNQGVKTLPS
nr:hypothetical protein Iba_chr09dCG1300 [Ipomoea batatas]